MNTTLWQISTHSHHSNGYDKVGSPNAPLSWALMQAEGSTAEGATLLPCSTSVRDVVSFTSKLVVGFPLEMR